jgi:4-amino-4-deoxy-L-arabinose transferase-like glycosyltransferase
MNKKLLIISLALAAMLIVAFFASNIKYEDFILTDEQGKSLIVDFPYRAESPRGNGTYEYELKGKMYLSFFSPQTFRIIPDDKILSITINGNDVSLAHIPENKKADIRSGFIINLSKYLHSGENSIEIKFLDYGGYMVMKMLPSQVSLYLLSFTFLLFIMFVLSKKMYLPKRYTFILFLAIVIRVLYLSVTDFNVRDHDIYAHIEYLKYFVENWALPPIEKAVSGAFFHPPLYYFSAALIYSGVSYLTNGNTSIIYFSLQVLSLLASIGFVFYGIKTTRLIFAYFIKNDSSLLQKVLPWICCLLIALWPTGIIHSTRISNDPFLYFFFAAALYGWTNLYLRIRSKHLFMAVFFTAAAILTKLNGALLIPLALVLFSLKAISGHILFSKRVAINSILASLIIIAALGFAMYPGIVLKAEGKRNNIYITYMYGGLVVGNKVENLLWLDIKTFVNEPFTSPWDDKYGRQYFPNYIGKTALFGEWGYNGVAMHNIAVAMSIVALAMFAIFITFSFKTPIKDIKILLPILLILFFLLCGVTYMRITFPVNIDFRYILPSIIPFSIFYNYGINLLLCGGKRRFAISAIFLELLFCLFSVLFIIEILQEPLGYRVIGQP